MSPPYAYLLTFTAYGTWLPGDERGWISRKEQALQLPNPALEEYARKSLAEHPVNFTPEQITIIRQEFSRISTIRNWEIKALAVLSAHVHVVIAASGLPEKVMGGLKAAATKKLHSFDPARKNWWTARGNVRALYTPESVNNALEYVNNHIKSKPPPD